MRSPSADGDPRMREHALDEHTRHPVAGRGATGMHDPSSAVTPLEPEVVVELDTELHEIADSRGRLGRQRGDRARAREPSPGPQRVVRVQRGRVVAPERRCDAALGQRAGRRTERSLGEHEDSSFGGRAESCEQAGNARAHDDEVEHFGAAGSVSLAHASFRL